MISGECRTKTVTSQTLVSVSLADLTTQGVTDEMANTQHYGIHGLVHVMTSPIRNSTRCIIVHQDSTERKYEPSIDSTHPLG